jgi:hypothetical protein
MKSLDIRREPRDFFIYEDSGSVISAAVGPVDQPVVSPIALGSAYLTKDRMPGIQAQIIWNQSVQALRSGCSSGNTHSKINFGSGPIPNGDVLPCEICAASELHENLQTQNTDDCDDLPHINHESSPGGKSWSHTKPTENIKKTKNFFRLFSCSLLSSGIGRQNTTMSRITLIAADAQP